MELDLIPVVAFMKAEADREGKGPVREFLKELHRAMRVRADPLLAAADRRKPDKYLAFRKVRLSAAVPPLSCRPEALSSA